MTNALGLLVTIDHRANGGGMLQVRYRTLEQLDDVMRRLEPGRRLKTMPTALAAPASGGLEPSHRFISAPSNPSTHPMSASQFGHWT